MRLGCSFAMALYQAAAFTAALPAPSKAFTCSGQHPEVAAAKTAQRLVRPLATQGRLDVLVVQARFADDAQSASLAGILDPNRVGSLSHFYDTMSNGQLQVRGTVLPEIYTAPLAASHYVATEPGELGASDVFARHILAQVDVDVDLTHFDNDGDGTVDYLFLVLPNVPRGFIVDGATGFAGLGLAPSYISSDVHANGTAVEVSGSRYRGAIVEISGFATTVGAMAHELGHGFGLPDLYDVEYDDRASDSAGIGRWGLMGLGATGWNGDDGPNPFSAWTLEQLGWIGVNNNRLVDIDTDQSQVQMSPLGAGGLAYRVPLRATFMAPGAVFAQEYLLLEYRSRRSYYDRGLPGEGLLVWHVRPQEGGNTNESHKLVDLICADQAAQPYGEDDLDRWAHDGGTGNQGDATDPFDGVAFGHLQLVTSRSGASTALRVDVTSVLGGIAIGVRMPRWSGHITGDVEWLGQVMVDGDLTIGPNARLTVYPETQVLVGADRTRGGVDPQRAEIRVQGQLIVSAARLTRWERRSFTSYGSGPVVFRSGEAEATWYGVLDDNSASMAVPADALLIENALFDSITTSAEAYARSSIATVVAGAASSPASLALMPNYPNPFNPATMLRFELPDSQPVQLNVYDALGQRIRTLVDGIESAGRHEVLWDGRNDRGQAVASGIYVYRLETAHAGTLAGRMVLAR